MMGSTYEVIRDAHNQIESLECAGANLMNRKARKELSVSLDQCLSYIVNAVSARTHELSHESAEIMSVADKAVHSSSNDNSSDVWHIFYHRIRNAKEKHKKYDASTNLKVSYSDRDTHEQAAIDFATTRTTEFTSAEYYGKCVDMSSLHLLYLNLKKVREFKMKSFVQHLWSKYLKTLSSEKESAMSFQQFYEMKKSLYMDVDYICWLREFSDFEYIPRYLKYKQDDYMEYIRSCEEYLTNFMKRQSPLLNIDEKLKQHNEQFLKNWRQQVLPGWEQMSCDLPLYVAETDKLFANENTMLAHKNGKDYGRARTRFESMDEVEKTKLRDLSIARDIELAKTEQRIKFLRDALSETIEDTIDVITRKQARTAREVENELTRIEFDNEYADPLAGEESDSASSGGEVMDASDRAIFNPKNLPLGWDGKPIPYWIYKLHGLGKEFKCEICGNHSYFGRRAFDQHFGEIRHINGLKALRIPSSVQFHGVTGIEDAILLYQKLRTETSAAIFNADKEMECEDNLGNVMSYRAYQDLAKQGLL